MGACRCSGFGQFAQEFTCICLARARSVLSRSRSSRANVFRNARIVFEKIAPRYVDRPGGYTRILKLATPRLGDAGPRALLEFVGTDVAASRSQAPKVESVRPARA